MKKLKLQLLVLMISFTSFAQVGIGTTTPNGALDITSTTTGLVLPRVALTATNIATPVVNPQGGALLAGTTVYNTASTTGTYGVTPGFYFWDGSKWVSQFQRVFSAKYEQTAGISVGSTATPTYTTITGINTTFTAPFGGTYQFVFLGYLGAKQVNDITTNLPSTRDISGYAAVGFVEGYFRLSINGADYDAYNHANSFYRSGSGNNGSGGTNYYELFKQVTIIINVQLTAGQVCTFSSSYGGVADDNITTPNPHVVGRISGLGNKCNLTVTYIGQ